MDYYFSQLVEEPIGTSIQIVSPQSSTYAWIADTVCDLAPIVMMLTAHTDTSRRLSTLSSTLSIPSRHLTMAI